VHNISKSKQPTTLEIAAARGFVSWKVPYAFKHGGTHYANELSHAMMYGDFDQVIRSWVRANLVNSIIKLPGSCFEILNSNPQLRESIDAIYVQNLQHFFNPLQDCLFWEHIADLLAPEGHAFLCANSFVFGKDTDHPIYKLFLEKKRAGVKYPSFAKFQVTFKQNKFMQAQYDNVFSDVSRPNDDAHIEKIDIAMHYLDPVTVEATQETVINSFSPSIYKDVIAMHPRLEVVDAFFIDKNGIRSENWSADIQYAAVIIKKKSNIRREEQVSPETQRTPIKMADGLGAKLADVHITAFSGCSTCAF